MRLVDKISFEIFLLESLSRSNLFENSFVEVMKDLKSQLIKYSPVVEKSSIKKVTVYRSINEKDVVVSLKEGVFITNLLINRRGNDDFLYIDLPTALERIFKKIDIEYVDKDDFKFLFQY